MNGKLIIKDEPEFIIQDDENIEIVQYFNSDINDELVTDEDNDGDDGDDEDNEDDDADGTQDEIKYFDKEVRFSGRSDTTLVSQMSQIYQNHQQRNREQSFSTNGHYHKIGITNETISRTKIYVCNVCNEQFERSYQLKRHYFIGEHDDIKNISLINKKSTPPAVPIMIHRANGSLPPATYNKQLKRISNEVSQQQQQKQTPSQHLYSKLGKKSQVKLANTAISTNPNRNGNEQLNNFDGKLRNLKKNLLPSSNSLNFKSKRLDQNYEHNDFKDEHDDDADTDYKNFDHIEYNTSNGSNKGSHVGSHESNGSHVLMNVVTNKGNNQLAKKKEQFIHLNTDETEWSHIIICDIEGDNGESFEDIMFKCQLCNIYFSEIDLLDNHLQLHNPGISYAHKCELCDEVFSHVAILRNHVISHVNWKNRYKCVKCERSFETALSLRVHSNIRMAGICSPPQHKCIMCKKIFLTERLLIAHQFYHTGRKEYKCKYCRTVKLNDSTTKETSNSNNIKEFIHWSSLQMHLQSNAACKERRELPINVINNIKSENLK